ncbi:MAG: hypothetical protein ACE5I8_05315 [Thermodesulfobacteriota bacterium]
MFQVYGINLLIKILSEPPSEVRLHCPQGFPVRCGMVVSQGDGLDTEANFFRPMPGIGTTVVFEEPEEDVEGHYFYCGQEEYRVLPLDAVIISQDET